MRISKLIRASELDSLVAKRDQPATIKLENGVQEVQGGITVSRALAEKLVDAVGQVLGVDTGTISEHKFDLAVKAAQQVLMHS